MTEQALNGLIYCGQILIPALFPFMVLSELLCELGFFERIAFIFSKPCSKLIKLPGAAVGAVVLSMVGGFPVGAACTARLYERGLIDYEQGCRMLRFVVGAGPAFVIFALGEKMLGSIAAGLVLYAAQILSQLTIAISEGLISKSKITDKKSLPLKSPPFSESLINSCFKSSESILKLCAMVVMFSAFMGILSDIRLLSAVETLMELIRIPSSIAHSLVYVLLEVTAGCSEAVSAGAPLEFIAFAVGFGGLSVHFQIFALLGRLNISKTDFFLHRLLAGTLCSVYTYILSFFIPGQVQVITISTPQRAQLSSSTLIGSLALIFCCLIFVLSLKSSRRITSLRRGHIIRKEAK